jgi:NitT/TauT family transport system ATP-binding protein
MKPFEGEVLVDGDPVRKPGADRGMVFQQHALFPWKTVLGNIEFGLRMAGVKASQRRKVSLRLLEMVGLVGFEDSLPSQLSGGMQQRVGIARALANNPGVLLMDEPFGSLDALTRVKMQELLLQLWQELRTTVIFVTHDVEEAIFLADRVVMLTARPAMKKGIIDIDLPRPRNKEMITSRKFNEFKSQCLEMLHTESQRPIHSPDPDMLTFGVGGVAWQAPERQKAHHAR